MNPKGIKKYHIDGESAKPRISVFSVADFLSDFIFSLEN